MTHVRARDQVRSTPIEGWKTPVASWSLETAYIRARSPVKLDGWSGHESSP
jgi:hypothetical protein